MNQEVSRWVVDWFFSRDKIQCSAQEALGIDYLQAGLLSSLEIVELVAALEDRFEVQFSEAEMQDPRFSTIGGIAELVVAALNQEALKQEALDQKGLNQASKVG